MTILQDFLAVLRNIKESVSNLKKDVDRADPREETKSDMEVMTVGFSDLKAIMKNMTDEDRTNLQREVKELFTGQESMADYTRDVQKILIDVKNRAASDVQVKEKIEQNVPIEHKEKDSSSLFDGFSKLLNQLNEQLNKK